MESNHDIIVQNLNNHHNNSLLGTSKNNIDDNKYKNKTTASPNRETSPPLLPPPRTHGFVTSQACAACKYQRRKCVPDCILAPYFPHNRQRQFLNAHRLFGVSNIIKIIKNLEPLAKDNAMRTIIFQSEARAADPVGGCHRIIRDLEQRIGLAKAELEIVLQHLAICRSAAAHQQQQNAAAQMSNDGGDGRDPTINGDPFGYYNNYSERWRGAADDVSSWGCMHWVDDGNVHANAESLSTSFPNQRYNQEDDDNNYNNNDNNNNNDNHVKKLSTEDCGNDVKPILENFSCDDDGEFRFDSHGNIISSNNGILTEEKTTFKEDDSCFPYIEDQQDLKAAATFFSLTNYDL